MSRREDEKAQQARRSEREIRPAIAASARLVMRVQELVIRHPLPDLNALLKASASSPYVYSKMKKAAQKIVALYALEQRFQKITEPSHFVYLFGEPVANKDPSNVCAGGIKVVEDALQAMGLLPNDNWKWVLSFTSSWEKSPRPFVKLTVWSGS